MSLSSFRSSMHTHVNHEACAVLEEQHWRVLNCHCSVEDDVSPVLESLASLEHLSLGFNELEGELTCGLLGPEKKLHELDLAHNEIEGSIPECLLSSSALQELYLANNALSGSLPRMLEDVPLTTLSVSDQASIVTFWMLILILLDISARSC